jgi:RNA polymerase sigma-70 factor (ECF subfamily)
MTSGGPSDDRALVARMLAGEEQAFEEFFEGYFPGLYRFALARTGRDAEAAEEVVQAALCRAVSKLETYRGEAALFTWLCTFCRHEISAYYRRQRKSGPPVALVEETPEVRAALESLADESAWRAADESRRDEIARLVQVTLDHLPPRYGRVLEWKYLEGRPVKEIAERLDLGLKAAESLLTRAREAFRDGFAAVSSAAAGSES